MRRVIEPSPMSPDSSERRRIVTDPSGWSFVLFGGFFCVTLAGWSWPSSPACGGNFVRPCMFVPTKLGL
jgi:hypothetical protein